MSFHREGKVSIFLAVLIAAALVISAQLFFHDWPIAQPIAMALAAFVLVVVLQFFRNPRRHMLVLNDSIIAPADGKIVVIEEVVDQEYFKKPMRQVSIFMSPTNVHINWFPIAGTVNYSQYHPGKYLVAWDPKSSTDNERHSVVVNNPRYGEVLVKQIAGAVARRIVNYAKTGQSVEQGKELGFIKFGSRVDLLFPLEAEMKVNLGQKTIGGQTIIASFPAK
jgi:phosphatidylserine decarboxylase